jgi:hypothetical protein
MPFLDPVIDSSSIRLKRSAVGGETPSAGSLRQGELAVNTADAALFLGADSGSVKIGGSPVTLAYAATVTTDASAGDIFDITLTGNVTLANPTNPVNGKTVRWRIRQDSGGNRTITLGNKFVIPSSASTPLPFSTTGNKMDIFAATYHAARDKWDVVAMVPGY